MAANRMIRDWTDSERMDSLTAEAERFFTRLIMKADDYGRYVGHPMLLKANLFPLSSATITVEQILGWINECIAVDLLFDYECNGKKYLEINNFGQRMRVKVSKYPESGSAGLVAKLTNGYVYFIGEDLASDIKIGFSVNPWSRVKEISTGNHADLKVLLTFKAEKKTESLLQKLLGQFRTNREWFKLTPQILDYFVQLSKNEDIDLEHELRSNYEKLRSCLNIEEEEEEEEVELEVETEIESVIEYLNEKTVSNFRRDAEKNKKNLRARFREKFTRSDFEAVIDFKFGQWGLDPKMKEYLRPETLFGNKFEGYLQAARGAPPLKVVQSKFAQANKDISESREKFKKIIDGTG